MKRVSLLMMASLCLFATVFQGCKKDDDDDDDDTPTQSPAPTSPTPEFNGADAVLVGFRTISFTSTPVGDIEVNIDGAVAAFLDGSGDLLAAGTVECNDAELEKTDNNSYYVIDDGTGNVISLSTTVGPDWSVSGGSGFSAFTYTPTDGVPTNVKLDGDYSTVDIDNAVTIQLESVPTNADSILFNLIDQSGNLVTKTTAGNVSSCTFSASEVNVLENSTYAYVQVAAYNFELAPQGGKNVYFVCETVITQQTKFE